MLHQLRDDSLGDGVYFAPSDYIGVGRRILILCVDTITLGLLGLSLETIWFQLLGNYEGFIGVFASAVWLYLVPLKRSAWRTIGYRLAGAKLVNLKGQQPALWLLTLRSLLWIFASFNIFFELLWCSVDRDRQSVRDRLTNMCVVKNTAIPIGAGQVHLAYYFVLGYMLAYSYVVHPEPSKAPTPC